MRFVGYSLTQKEYRLYDDNQRRIFIRRDVTFNETDFGHTKVPVKFDEESRGKTEIIPYQRWRCKDCARTGETDKLSQTLRKTKKSTSMLLWRVHSNNLSKHTGLYVTDTEETKTLKEVLEGECPSQWKVATDTKYQSLMENKIWELVEPPLGRKPISCKWVLKARWNKKDKKLKRRLVAKGFMQKYGIDCDETFSLVVRFSLIWAFLHFSVSQRMLIHWIDVVTKPRRLCRTRGGGGEG